MLIGIKDVVPTVMGTFEPDFLGTLRLNLQNLSLIEKKVYKRAS